MATAKKAAQAATNRRRAAAQNDVPFEGGEPVKPAPKAKAAKAPKFVIPKKIGDCADALYKKREERLALQKQVELLAEQESQLKNHIINNLPKSNTTGVSGKVANVRVVTEDVPQVKDWDKLQAYIKKNGAFDLLQRRVNAKAVEERWADKKKVPGVEAFGVTKVSCTKV